MKKNLVLSLSAFFLVATAFAFFQTKPWTVPAKEAGATNPVKKDAASIAAGKTLWAQHCASCHGKTGKGDGNKAAQLETTPPDFTKAAFQSQSDGSLHFKTAVGRGDMPAFKKKIPDTEDIWSLVNFMRTLKK